MNRFRIARGSEEVFEDLWRNRDSHLEGVPGFETFHLLKGAPNDTHTPFISHSTWRSRKYFEAWTDSEAFRKAQTEEAKQKGFKLTPLAFLLKASASTCGEKAPSWFTALFALITATIASVVTGVVHGLTIGLLLGIVRMDPGGGEEPRVAGTELERGA